MFRDNEPPSDVRRIRTARTKEEINEAARNGLFPLVRLIDPSPAIREKFAVLQSEATGEVLCIGDFRLMPSEPEWKIVVDWTSYYPHTWNAPFAAYLLPPDLKEGETVFLEDLIEDVVAETWNQGGTRRLTSCLATWSNGDLLLQWEPERDQRYVVG